jgi:hypothetical protein
MQRRVLIFPNTPWEADALVSVFTNGQARPATHEELAGKPPLFQSYYFPPTIPTPKVLIPSLDGEAPTTVRARLAYPDVEVWCVSDLMIDKKNLIAGSKEKARVLKYVADNGPSPTLAIAFGTAAFPDSHIYDGCVVVGSNVYNFDPKIDDLNENSRWDDPSIGDLSDNSKQPINSIVFPNLRGRLRLPIESRFLSPPIATARSPFLLASGNYVAVSDVNVASVDDYAWADREAVKGFLASSPRATPGSVETTHGIIHAVVQSDQFLFVSGIANRLGYFNMEAAPRNYAQDFAVAHNAAITLSWLLPCILDAPL